jgi:hypothetical protein
VDILKVMLRQRWGEHGFDGSAKWLAVSKPELVPVLKWVRSM